MFLFATSDHFREEALFKNYTRKNWQKKIDRLNVIAARFSQIGLEGTLRNEIVKNKIEENIDYSKFRISSYVSYFTEDVTGGASPLIPI